MSPRSPLIFLLSFSLCTLILAPRPVRADAQGEARSLKDEALVILKANADIDGKPEDMAKCIFNLEKSAHILEVAHDTDSDLAKEVNSQLYWARKRSTLAIDAALDKLKGNSGASHPYVPKPPASKPPVKKEDGDDPFAGMADARKAFDEAQKFAQSHGSDDYVVSLNWFQMASLHPGTDYSLKALNLAREAQARFKAINPNAVKEVLPDTPEMKLVLEADALAASKDYAKAIPLYQASIKLKESQIAHRKLGQSFYAHAMQVKEKVIADCEIAYVEWKSARENAMVERRMIGGAMRKFLNANDPNYQAATRKYQAAFKAGDQAFDLFEKARVEFSSVLRLAPNGKDLISAGLMGICMSQKPDITLRSKAKSHLLAFLREYAPVNDDERAIYEYCRTELERLTK